MTGNLDREPSASARKPVTPASRSFSVDTTPPDTTINAGPAAAATTTADATPSFAFTSRDGGSTHRCALDAHDLAPCSGPGATHTPPTLADGSHTFTVAAADAAGNVSASSSRSFRVDTRAPETTITRRVTRGATARFTRRS